MTKVALKKSTYSLYYNVKIITYLEMKNWDVKTLWVLNGVYIFRWGFIIQSLGYFTYTFVLLNNRLLATHKT